MTSLLDLQECRHECMKQKLKRTEISRTWANKKNRTKQFRKTAHCCWEKLKKSTLSVRKQHVACEKNSMLLLRKTACCCWENSRLNLRKQQVEFEKTAGWIWEKQHVAVKKISTLLVWKTAHFCWEKKRVAVKKTAHCYLEQVAVEKNST